MVQVMDLSEVLLAMYHLYKLYDKDTSHLITPTPQLKGSVHQKFLLRFWRLTLIFLFVVIFFFPSVVYADSSWILKKKSQVWEESPHHWSL